MRKYIDHFKNQDMKSYVIGTYISQVGNGIQFGVLFS